MLYECNKFTWINRDVAMGQWFWYSGDSSSMSPLIWIKPARLRRAFFIRANLYETVRNVISGLALSFDFVVASSVPSAALIINDDVVFSGI